MFLKILQNSQENTCARASFLIKKSCLRPATLLKRRLWYRCSPVNFVKILRTPISIEHLQWLLLSLNIMIYKSSLWLSRSRSSHQRCSIKIAVLKNLAKFTGKQPYWSLFLVKPWGSNTGASLWILRNF